MCIRDRSVQLHPLTLLFIYEPVVEFLPAFHFSMIVKALNQLKYHKYGLFPPIWNKLFSKIVLTIAHLWVNFTIYFLFIGFNTIIGYLTT